MEKALIKTSILQARPLVNDNRGFSLLEIAVVLSIIGAVIAIAAPRLFDKKTDTRRVFRDFIVAGKDLKSRAKLSGSTYRLAFDLTPKQQSWWVEKSTKAVLIDKAKLEKEFENNKNPDKNAEKPPPDFLSNKRGAAMAMTAPIMERTTAISKREKPLLSFTSGRTWRVDVFIRAFSTFFFIFAVAF